MTYPSDVFKVISMNNLERYRKESDKEKTNYEDMLRRRQQELENQVHRLMMIISSVELYL